jgi:hypothetical protein
MNGCGARQSPMRLHNHRPSRGDGRSQERRQPARSASEPLTAGRRGGYLTHCSKDNGRPILTVRSTIKLYTLTPPRLPPQGFGPVV